jgi:predicted  nucleic acid-binding Zn-ribbon protein
MDCYCLKCKEKTSIKDPKGHVTDKGRMMVMGTCSKCGSKVSRIVAKAETTGNGIFSALFQAAKPALKKAGEEALKAGATEAAKAAGKKVGEKLGDKVTGKGVVRLLSKKK